MEASPTCKRKKIRVTWQGSQLCEREVGLTMLWVFEVLLYGFIKGFREIIKKKSLKDSSVIEVLFFYTLLSFLFVSTQAGQAMGVDGSWMLLIVIKSFVIFLAWMLSFYAIRQMPISLYGILDLSRVLFATLLAVIVLRETLGFYQVMGLILVCSGLLLLRVRKKDTEKENVSAKIVILALGSCLLNALSGLLDKILMQRVTSSQLQFWYMLFLVGFYLLYILFTKQKLDVKKSLSNRWIWLLAILFVIADRSLFLANQNPNSKITVMTLVKQSGCVVTILAGKFLFHEKNIRYKLFCTAVIVAGIVIAVL